MHTIAGSRENRANNHILWKLFPRQNLICLQCLTMIYNCPSGYLKNVIHTAPLSLLSLFTSSTISDPLPLGIETVHFVGVNDILSVATPSMPWPVHVDHMSAILIKFSATGDWALTSVEPSAWGQITAKSTRTRSSSFTSSGLQQMLRRHKKYPWCNANTGEKTRQDSVERWQVVRGGPTTQLGHLSRQISRRLFSNRLPCYVLCTCMLTNKKNHTNKSN